MSRRREIQKPAGPRTILSVVGTPQSRAEYAAYARLAQTATEMADWTPEEQLGWVFDFATRDLEAASAAERLEFTHRLRVLAQTVHPAATEKPWQPMPIARLAKLQAQIVSGLQALLGEAGKWKIPEEKLAGELTLVRDPRHGPRLGLVWIGREPGILLYQIAYLLSLCGQKLRACARCQRPFLALDKRKLFCSRRCAQLTAIEHYRKRHRTELQARRRRAYERKLRARFGDKVKIQQRRLAEEGK